MFVLQNSVSGECWEPSTAELPVIKLTCYKDGVKEEITVTEDATGWPFSKVMDACQVKIDEWRDSQ
tara:strand:+ start:456 stop:653 length:198 start_codon:yes stop_codon:yes gene_type:complete